MERTFSEQEVRAILANMQGHFADRLESIKNNINTVLTKVDEPDYVQIATSATLAMKWEAKLDAVLAVAERLNISLEG